MKRARMRIGDELRDSGRVELVRSPFDGAAVGEVCVGGPTDLDDAVAAAHAAFRTTRSLPTHRRAAILEGTAERLARREDELAALRARESGKPIRFSRAEVRRAVVTFRLGAAEAARFGGEVLPIDLEARAEGRLCLWSRVPRGPVAAISPFNFPLNLAAHKLAPAVAVGASLVLKPPPQAPLTAHVLAEILAEAGAPPGLINVVHCAPETAQRMVEDPRLAVLSFTGSDLVGWKLKSVAGKKQVLLELGGNAPCIVDRDVDLDAVIEPILTASFAHAGQVCIKVQRLYVHEALFGPFLERFVAATRALKCGDPLDEETVVGPLIEQKHVERVLAWVREAQDGGARLHCGGDVEGRVVAPMVLTGTRPGMRVCKDEVFGPVTVIEPWSRFGDVLEACNAGRFGLQAGLFTRDLGHALQAFRELDYGGVLVNEVPTFRVDNFPYGGTKDSGLGREGVRFAMEELSVPTLLVLRGPLGGRPPAGG